MDTHISLDGDWAVFESPVFAWGVSLDLDGDAVLPDNAFDLLPGRCIIVPATAGSHRRPRPGAACIGRYQAD